MKNYDDRSDYRGIIKEQWNQELKSVRTAGFVVSILMLLLGICCIIWPAPSMKTMGVLASILIMALGVFEIICYGSAPIMIRRAGTLISGILNILVGLLLLCSPTAVTLATFTYLLGFLLFMFGIDLLVFAGRLRFFSITGYGWLIFNGVMSIVVALLFLLMPLVSAAVLNYAIAAYLLADGLALLVETVSMKEMKA